MSNFIARNLLFRHGTESGRLRNSDESTGTMAWLALGTAVVSALRQGKVLVVDELGASLHPQLSRLIIDWFEDPEINTTGAQLIFTSHDMTLLDAGRGDREKWEQVWFVEKAPTERANSSTSLTSRSKRAATLSSSTSRVDLAAFPTPRLPSFTTYSALGLTKRNEGPWDDAFPVNLEARRS